jgi:hypothetical protein
MFKYHSVGCDQALMALFKKTYHPLDSRHQSNRACAKALDHKRDVQTRSGKRKLENGSFFKGPNVQDMRAQLNALEGAAVQDVATQKRLKRKLPELERKQAEKAFWNSQGFLGHFGIFGLINQVRALMIGDKAAGLAPWMRFAKFPLALALYFLIMNVSAYFPSLTSTLALVDGSAKSSLSTSMITKP